MDTCGRRVVTMIPGDGVGPELMTSVKSVFSAAGAPIDFEEVLVRYCSGEFMLKLGWFKFPILMPVLCIYYVDMHRHCYLILVNCYINQCRFFFASPLNAC